MWAFPGSTCQGCTCTTFTTKYPRRDQLRLLFTDTESLAYAVQAEDIYRDMAGNAATHYDFSNQGRTEFGAYATVCRLGSKVLCFPLHG